MSRVEIVPIKPYSDGDASHRPNSHWKLVRPPTIYMEKVAALWMEKRGEAKLGMKYYLDKLPDGYTLWERPRPKDARIVDKHLYGHPNKRVFDSPNRFFPHFEYLMTNGTNQGCYCTICGAKGSVPLAISHSASRKILHTPKPVAPQTVKASLTHDEELTPDTIRQCIDKLKISGQIDISIEEKLSIDWRTETLLLPEMLSRVSKQKSWLPRAGELVLFIRDDNGEICLDNKSQEYKIVQDEVVSTPQWEAGIIGQTPEEAVTLEDIVVQTTKTQGISYSGYRVEPLPNPHSNDKSLSRQYKYVPLHHIRPFIFWQEVLKGIPDTKWHTTIHNVMTVMASISLLNKFRFKGIWPTATVFCGGVYIGSELICVGDTVRIIPRKSEVRDVVLVGSIRLLLSNLDKASDDDTDEGHPYNTAVHICGKAFTLDESRAWQPTPVSRAHPGMEGYDDWFWLHDPTKSYRLNFASVLGRCFEANPMRLWFPNTKDDDAGSSLTRGLTSVQHARAFSAKNDRRILPGKSWFWGDSRAETLDIKSLNNIDTSYYDTQRDEETLKDWQKATKVLSRTASKAEEASLARKVMNHRLSTSQEGKEVGRGGALRAAAAVTAGTNTPNEERTGRKGDTNDNDDDDYDDSDNDSLQAISHRGSESISTASQPVDTIRAGLFRKRNFSTLSTSTSTSRDELDQDLNQDLNQDTDPDISGPYSLEEWVKPVATLHNALPTTKLAAAAAAATATATVQLSPHRPRAPPTPFKYATNPTPTQLGQKQTVASSEPSYTSTKSTTSMALPKRTSPGAALAAFKKPRVVINIDD